MPILPKKVYRVNAIPIEIPTQLFTVLKGQFSVSYGKTNKQTKTKIVKIILNNKRIAGGLTIPNFRVIVKRTTWN